MEIVFESVTNEDKSKNSKFLLEFEPGEGILGVLDLIFDYFTFEDLEIMVGAWKYFCHVALLDRLYVKYNIEDSVESIHYTPNSQAADIEDEYVSFCYEI